MSALNALMVAVSVAERKRDEARQTLQNAQAAQQAALNRIIVNNQNMRRHIEASFQEKSIFWDTVK